MSCAASRVQAHPHPTQCDTGSIDKTRNMDKPLSPKRAAYRLPMKETARLLTHLAPKNADNLAPKGAPIWQAGSEPGF